MTVALVGKGVIANADAIADTAGGTWLEIGGGAISYSTDTKLIGSGCIAGAYSNKNGWHAYDIGATNELDFDVAGTEEGQLIYLWIHAPTIGLFETKANKGLAIRIGSSQTDYREFLIAGSDDANGWNGGWKCFVVDPTKTGTVADTGTFDLSLVRYFGVWVDAAAVARGDNIFMDQIIVGNGIRITDAGHPMWVDVVGYCADYANRGWGTVQEREGIYYLYGKIYFGDTAQTAGTAFWEGYAPVLKFGVTEYWTGSAWALLHPTDYAGVVVQDNASWATVFNDAWIVGTDEGRGGTTYIGDSRLSIAFDLLSGALHANSSIQLYNTKFNQMAGGIDMGADIDFRFYSGVLDQCGIFNPRSARCRNLILSNTLGTAAAMLWGTDINIADCSFIANTLGPAIDHDLGGTFSYSGLAFSGNTYDILNSISASQVAFYSESNQDTDIDLNGTNLKVAQSMGGVVVGLCSHAMFYLKKTGSPTGNLVAKLYETNFPTNNDPVGDPLTTSEPVLASSIGASYALQTFEFKEAFEIQSTTIYAISIEYEDGDVSNYISVGVDNSSPPKQGHLYITSWVEQTWEVCFYLYAGGLVIVNASNGANPSGAKVLTTGTPPGITDINNPVSFKFTVDPSITSYEWRIYEVTALGSLVGAVEIDGEESATADNQTYPYTYSSDQPIAVQIIPQPDEDFVESITYYTLKTVDQNIIILLKEDINN